MKKVLPVLALLLTALVILVCVLAKTSAGIDEILSAAVCALLLAALAVLFAAGLSKKK